MEQRLRTKLTEGDAGLVLLDLEVRAVRVKADHREQRSAYQAELAKRC